MKNSRKLLSAISVTLCMSILLSSEMAICADAIDVTKTNLPDCNDGIVSVIEEMNNSDEQDSKIIGEIEDERSEYIKRFKLNNGATMAVQYSMPVHYKDAEGKWVEYNNSLISTTDNGDEVFDNYDSNVDIKLSKKAKENNMIKVKSSEYAVSWGFVGVDKVKGTVMLRDTNDSLTENEKLTMPKNATSEVVYYDVYDDVDLQYILSSLGIKENIILKSSNTQRNFEVKYKVNNLEAKQIDDKTITLYDKKENPIYTINAPFMTDADGDMCNNVSIAIQNQKGSNLTVKISVDDKFFDENCHYPVVIDPMFYTNQNWNDGIQCTFADSSQPNQNFAYGGPDGYTGTIYTGSFGQGVYRSFIKLNTLPTLNAGDMIVDARLNLHLYDSDFYKDVYINAYEITSGWNQTTLTWNNQPTCNNTVLDYIKLGQSSAIDWYQLDITNIAKKWYNCGSNYGIAIKDYMDTSADQCAAFYSYFYPASSSPRAVFSITYINNKGLEDYWSYSSFDVGTAGTAYINDYTGNLVFVHNGASIAGNNNFTLQHIFNNYMADTVNSNILPLSGKGWRLNVEQRVVSSAGHGLSEEYSAIYPYVYEDGDGTEHYFMKVEVNEEIYYYDEDGLGLELIVDNLSSSARYKISDYSDNIMEFDSNGNLRKISDSNDNIIDINRTVYGKITSVTTHNTVNGSSRNITLNSVCSIIKQFQKIHYIQVLSGISDKKLQAKRLWPDC